MQNFRDLLQGKHFRIWGWMGRGRKNVHFFKRKNWPYLRNCDR